jgi:electron transport complex protein RnfE
MENMSENRKSIFTKGLIRENAVFVMLLGLCPVLGTTTSAINGLGMGVATLFVLVLSNMAVSMVKSFIPSKVRIPAYIVIIASFVTMIQLLMQAYTPGLYEALGIFIPLIVVNCLILGRAEAFASKNSLFDSLLDGLGMGLGFTLALTMLGAVREILGSLSLFGYSFVEGDGMLVFVLAPGGFLGLGYIISLMNRLKNKSKV